MTGIIVNFGHIMRAARAVKVAHEEFEQDLAFGTAESTMAAHEKLLTAEAQLDAFIQLGLAQDTSSATDLPTI